MPLDFEVCVMKVQIELKKASDPFVSFIRIIEIGKIVAEFVEWLFLEKF